MRDDTMHKGVPREICACTVDGCRTEMRELVEETAYGIHLNGARTETLRCSPWDIREAVIGYLYLRGAIRAADDIRLLQIDEASHTVTVHTEASAASHPQSAETPVTAREIISLAAQLEERSRLFHRTGGVHSAALARGGEMLVYREDVSRHVAVDKVAGVCLTNNIPMNGGVLVFSGRVPTEIIEKAAAMGCSMIIARSAPTDFACQLAEQAGITLIGFARDETFNIYTCPARVVF